MDYRKALNQKAAPIKENTLKPIEKTVYIPTDEENYKNNVKDSVITYLLPELHEMCTEFVNDTILLKNPILLAHHTGYKNFVIEMMNLFEENCDVNITEEIEEDSELEEDLDPMDIYNISNDKF